MCSGVRRPGTDSCICTWLCGPGQVTSPPWVSLSSCVTVASTGALLQECIRYQTESTFSDTRRLPRSSSFSPPSYFVDRKLRSREAKRLGCGPQGRNGSVETEVRPSGPCTLFPQDSPDLDIRHKRHGPRAYAQAAILPFHQLCLPSLSSSAGFWA